MCVCVCGQRGSSHFTYIWQAEQINATKQNYHSKIVGNEAWIDGEGKGHMQKFSNSLALITI